MKILKRFPAQQRIVLGLVGLMTCTLLFASAFGFFPNEQKEVLNGRAKFCDTLSLCITGMASSDELDTLKETLTSVVNRDDDRDNDLLSIGLRTDGDGQLWYAAGPHEETWKSDHQDTRLNQMRVPVYRGGNRWGVLEICFRDSGGFLGLNYWAPAWLLVVIVPACFVQFSIYLRKTLKHLDPSATVPQHVQDALDTLSVGLLLLDDGNKVIFANSEFAESVGVATGDLNGRHASDLAWEIPEGEASELPWTETLRTGQPVDERILQLVNDGRCRTFSVNCSRVGRGVMAIFDDITLLEEAREAALAASESKSAFLANMSHEIRTPLNAVLGFTDVLRRGLVTDTEESRDHLNMIHRSGKHLLELINDILDLSKIEGGKMEVECIDTHVHQIVQETADVLEGKARAKDLDLRVEFRSAIPRTIQCDPTRLKQIITNLVGNAIKFTQQGSVTISTILRDDRHSLEIKVIDTGIGLTPEQQEKVFESFSQADETTTRKFGGTGLGLSISRRLAEALGGSLTVQGAEGAGCTFTVNIPVETPNRQDLISPDEIATRSRLADSDQSGIIRLPAKPILVVDDGEANRRLIELVLGRAGAKVTTVENGLEAIKVLSREDFDLIFMDMQMPVMDGYSATERLRSVGLRTPIVALTGNAMKGDREKCLAAGCDDFLSKPVDIDQLLKTTCRYIGQASERAPAPKHGWDLATKPAANGPGQDRSTGNDSACDDPIHSTLPLDDEEFREIVADFVDRLPARLDAIAQAITNADFDAIAEDAHWLKGVGGTVGFADFTEPSKSLEQAAKQGDIEQISHMLQSIRHIQSRLVTPSVCQSDAIDQPPIDQPPIYTSLPTDDAEFVEIVEQFLEDLDERLEKMQRLCQAADFGPLADDAHWLKGTAGTVGYDELAERAADLEQATKRGSLEDSRDSMNEIAKVRRRLVVANSPGQEASLTLAGG